MKLERLYAITIYLLNHGRTSAKELADYFEVSTRTIQRDMDSLCLSGIPIVAVSGSAGGYEISERFQLDRQIATSEDCSYILTALQGFVSATDSQKVKQTLEKVSCALQPANDNGIILDFSVTREGDSSILQALQSAAIQKQTVSFTYTNNNNETRSHKVEPIAVIYRWYAWYLLAYSKAKDDYRFYKLVRMSDLNITDIPFTKEHESADLILNKTDKTDSRQYINVLIKCKETAKSRVMEYLKGTVIKECANGDTFMKLTVVENEHFWFGTLLSLGDQAEVIEPKAIRNRLLKSAEKIVSLYHGRQT